jgi:adenylyltransferase/sulfurtransferase
MAMEAIKLILGLGKPPLGELIIYDSLQTSFRSLKFSADPSCRLCGKEPSIRSVHNPETLQSSSCSSFKSMQTITAAELKARLDAPDFDAILIDVREVEEWEVVHIPEAKLMPLQTIPSQAANLPKDAEIIIHCKAGMRSAKACEYLSALGFSNVTNVTGGMDDFQNL